MSDSGITSIPVLTFNTGIEKAWILSGIPVLPNTGITVLHALVLALLIGCRYAALSSSVFISYLWNPH